MSGTRVKVVSAQAAARTPCPVTRDEVRKATDELLMELNGKLPEQIKANKEVANKLSEQPF